MRKVKNSLCSLALCWTNLIMSLYIPFSNLISLAFMTHNMTCIWSARGGFSSLWAPTPPVAAFSAPLWSRTSSSPVRSIPKRIRNSSPIWIKKNCIVTCPPKWTSPSEARKLVSSDWSGTRPESGRPSSIPGFTNNQGLTTLRKRYYLCFKYGRPSILFGEGWKTDRPFFER